MSKCSNAEGEVRPAAAAAAERGRLPGRRHSNTREAVGENAAGRESGAKRSHMKYVVRLVQLANNDGHDEHAATPEQCAARGRAERRA
eukprot:2538906-Pleurochrysis_carterae.AAC.1